MLIAKPLVALNKKTKFKRSTSIICYWENGLFFVENFLTGKHATIKSIVLTLIEELNDFTSLEELENRLPNVPNIPSIVKQLIDFDILINEGSPIEDYENLLNNWEWGIEAKYYHLKTNYVNFECNNEEVWQNLTSKAINSIPAPSPFFKIQGIIYSILPAVTALPKKDFSNILKNRRTCRSFLEKSISLNILSNILFYCWGMTGKYKGGDLGDVIFKSTPSGGSRHPIEVYFIANNIEQLNSGIYHYNVEHHSIGLIRKGRFNTITVDACSGQKWVRKAPVLFILTAILKRSMWKYEHSHAFRVVNLDAGHLGQTFHFICQNLDLGPFTTAASNNKLLEELLHLNPIEQPVLYLCATGYRNNEIEVDD